jgi:hypothetical protein
VSRLDYAPKLKEIKVTDIKKGLGVFTPIPTKSAYFAALKESLKKAGYKLAAADITVKGTLTRDGKESLLLVAASGQRFVLEGDNLDKTLAGLPIGSELEVTGDWKTVGVGSTSREVIAPREAKLLGSATARSQRSTRPRLSQGSFLPTKFDGPPLESLRVDSEATESSVNPNPVAPIRITSPGLTVYKGGALTPRVYLIKQHLGDLEVNRQVLNLSLSYTPSPRVQLEVELPISHTSFDDDVTSGAGTGLGNVTLWAKYRFFRKVKTYGDRQAAARFGLELPTGKKDAPTLAQLNAPAFVRQQLTPISGGLSPHFDVAFSQAGGRFIFGGNAEGIIRSDRDGFRIGNELKISTDFEYVLLPRKYVAPGGELFIILETSFVHRGAGRLAGSSVPGSISEYLVAPGLQYAAAPQFVIEGSFQFPVIRNTGALTLRTDRNLLLGVRYLF